MTEPDVEPGAVLDGETGREKPPLCPRSVPELLELGRSVGGALGRADGMVLGRTLGLELREGL